MAVPDARGPLQAAHDGKRVLLALQAELAQELEPVQGGLQLLTGRWWRKRWSRDKATGAMDQLLKLLEVGRSRSMASTLVLADYADQSKPREGRHQGMESMVAVLGLQRCRTSKAPGSSGMSCCKSCCRIWGRPSMFCSIQCPMSLLEYPLRSLTAWPT